jgi:2-C-methyl-D-erythritol 2,4-cyclodiphosphate synthase
MYRSGSGIDFHQLVEGREFWLGGIQVPHYKGALGHSDADVLLHAICDAMLGALALGDIGLHFPDTDAAYKGIDSKILLKKCNELILRKGYSVVNIDAMLCLEKPKIKPYVPAMRTCIAGILQVEEDAVSIKATTTEKMGFTGREEGVVAMASALLQKIENDLIVPVITSSAFPLPEYATPGSSGLDLRANISEPVSIASMERVLVPTGLVVQIPHGYEAQVRPRSGLALKQGITVLNSPGTIDSDYRGEIKVILINLGQQDQIIAPGDRIAQIVFQKVETIAWQQVESILESGRSSGGFGHSGVA